MTLDIKTYLNQKKKLVDDQLSKYIRRFCPSDQIYEPVWYAVEAGGKRVRPALCMAACESMGMDGHTVLPAACALEMIHTYSLIHDDLPALDNDELRRGKPSCHVRFGEATAILAGDALLTMAFEVLTEAGLSADSVHGHLWLRTTQIIATAAGCHGMLEGQVRDLAFEGTRLDQSELESLHQLKTGALLKAAVHCGALLAKADQKQIDQFITYADYIGLAFQVIDDILNVKGDPKVLGKAVGTDSQRLKNTYPALMGLEQSEAYARFLIDAALQSISAFDNKADALRALARFIVDRNH
jgi:geranylgeranyl diphosphate synthase type II